MSDAWLQSLQFTCLRFLQKPKHYLLVLVTLSITLGALTTAFNLNYLLRSKPLTYPEADNLYVFNHVIKDRSAQTDGLGSNLAAMLSAYKNYEMHVPDLTSMALLKRDRAFFISKDLQHEKVTSLFVTPEYFDMLDAPLVMGEINPERFAVKAEQNVAVISHAFWQKHFLGKENVLTQAINISGVEFEIVAVLDAQFKEPGVFLGSTDVWLPWQLEHFNEAQDPNWFLTKSELTTLVVAKEGASKASISTQLSSLIDTHYQDYLATLAEIETQSSYEVQLLTLRARMIRSSKESAAILFIATIGVAGIAFFNVALTMWVYATGNRQHFATLIALGARMHTVFMQMFMESLMILVASSLLGLLCSAWLNEILSVFAGEYFARIDELALGFPALIFMTLMSFVLSILFALITYRVLAHIDIRQVINKSNRALKRVKVGRFVYAVLMLQLVLATIVSIVAMTVISSSLTTLWQPYGFTNDELTFVSVKNLNTTNTHAANTETLNTVKNAITMINSSARTKVVYDPPAWSSMKVFVENDVGEKLGFFPLNFVTEGYFDFISLPLISGRVFSESEISKQSKVAIISESLAQMMGGAEQVLGSKYRIAGRAEFEIIGIVEDETSPLFASLFTEQGYNIYFPYQAWNSRLLIDFDKGKAFNELRLQASLNELNADIRIDVFMSVSQFRAQYLSNERISILVSLALIGIAVLLAIMGIFNVVQLKIQSQRFELAIRVSLGMRNKKLAWYILKPFINASVFAILFAMLVSWWLIGLMLPTWAVHLGFLNTMLTVSVAILLCVFISAVGPVKHVLTQNPSDILKSE
jgi:predicted permease